MQIKIYNNGTILAPMKNGTRFLDDVFGSCENYALIEIKRKQHFPKLKAVVVRPPIEHLSSALHTEILTSINADKKDIDIRSIILNFTTLNGDVLQTPHWNKDVYEILYWLWRGNKKNIKVIELKDLSNYLKSLKIGVKEHNPIDYNFKEVYKEWCTKEEIIEFVKVNYPEEWVNLSTQLQTANLFYDYLINKKIIDYKFI